MTETVIDRSANPATSLEFLSFRAAGQDYALAIMQVREIRCWSQPTILPNAPSYVRGVINLRGTVLPVVDLAERLGMARSDASARCVIVVVEHGERLLGLLVDAVSDILTRSPDDLMPPPNVAGSDTTVNFVEALTLMDDAMIRVLHLPRLFPDRHEDAA